MVESNQQWHREVSKDKVFRTLFVRRASITAPQSSNRGSETCFSGATLDLDVKRMHFTLPSLSTVRKYKVAAKARSEASENPCSSAYSKPSVTPIQRGIEKRLRLDKSSISRFHLCLE